MYFKITLVCLGLTFITLAAGDMPGGPDIPTSSKVGKSKEMKCVVCKSLMLELYDVISKVDPRKKIDVGTYRIQSDGKQDIKQKKYAGSEIHMMDVLETVCDSMDDYAQVRHKESGELDVIKLVVNGALNPNFGEYEVVQDPELNKGVKFHCQTLVEEYEDEIIAHFKDNSEQDVKEAQNQFCLKENRICIVKDEL
ncbi:unnamed protein product [Meganyctiphanes norvegica]|uniref:DUF3456 domain-containing protein n=1 Tax=Meganyctiphanes norvegica TaxID=48144 RepID=A0AAV2QVY9_MEGNR